MNSLICLVFLTLLTSVRSQWNASARTGHLGAEDAMLDAALPPSDDFTCTPERGFIRRGGTYNDPAETITESAEECCRLCSEDGRCKTWSRQRSTGECALMDVIPPLEPDEDFDSGFLGTVDAVVAVPEPDCLIEQNVSFPDGEVLEKTQTKNAKRCCRRCIDNVDCFSWYHNRGTNACVLNSNVPQVVERQGYRGAALV